ncbi:MAG: response regulator transcription factor, partial [Anaerolineales bacterium]
MSNVEDKYKPKNITQSKRRDISPTASSLVRRGLDELQAISSKHIRLLIVDNDPFTRYQLGNLVCSENDIEVVGEAGDGVEGLYWFYKLHPDVVCVRSHMQRLDGLAMTHILSERFPGSKVLIYGVHDAQEYYEQSIYAGAQDYLE